MFDIKNLTLKDWIIGGLILLIIALGYKYYSANSEIKKLANEIESLKKKIDSNSGSKLINLESVISSSNSDSDSESLEPTNYKTNKTIETFNNNKNNQEIKCDGDTCWISGRNAKNQVPEQKQIQKQVPEKTQQQIQKQVPEQAKQVPVQMQQAPLQMQQAPLQMQQAPLQMQQAPLQMQQVPLQMQQTFFEQNQVITQSNILPPIQQEDLDVMKDITSFLTMADCVVNEVDEIVGNNIYIPVDLKKIVNQIYESPETACEEEIKFNPVILDSNDVINVKPEQIESNLEIESVVPDFINIPLTLGCTPETNEINSETKNSKQEINDVIESEVEAEEQTETEKIKSMKINDLKNLAKKLNIKLTEHSRPKNRDQLIAEINKCQSTNSQKNI